MNAYLSDTQLARLAEHALGVRVEAARVTAAHRRAALRRGRDRVRSS